MTSTEENTMSKPAGGGHFVTREQMAAAARNVERYPWAAAERESAVAKAQRWMGISDEALWELVTEQTVGRSTNASVVKGCPACGEGINRFGGHFRVDVLADPWKIACPSCGGRFPTNDYAAFYRSGKQADSFFDPAKADRSLLFNTEHPDPQDPLHTFGVDDGTGWTDDEGESFKLVGVYGHYGVWTEVSAACNGLTRAFLLTGDTGYARKAGILLARIADVYPAMDWSRWAALGFFNSDGLSGRGRIYGRIWEPGLLTSFTRCYDAVRIAWGDRDPMFEFLGERRRRFGLPAQDTVSALCSHFEEHVIREGIRGIVKGDVARNEPGDQVTMAVLAVALDADDTDDWLDWIFREGYLRGRTPNGGHIPQLFAGEIDRDGVGSEAAPSYSLGWLYKGAGMNDLDHALRARPSYTRHEVRAFRRYRQMFLGHIRMLVLGRYVPAIGDTGKTGEPDLCGLTVTQCLEGLQVFGDPVFGQAAHALVDGDLSRIHGSVFEQDPEAVRQGVARIVERQGPLALGPDLMTGYGLALMRDGEGDRERALWLYYGRNTGHGHADRLNLGLYGFGLDLLPDLGYPEHARVWPKRAGWTNHTVSHNTVLVDRGVQQGSYTGKVRCCAESPLARVVSVESPDVYGACSAYGRTAALIRVSETDFYVVDLFHVQGGRSHHLSFHAAEGEVATEALDLVPQPRGTYAGPDVAFGQFYDGEVKGYRGSGFQYLYDMRRCPEPGPAPAVTWRVRDTWKVTPASDRSGRPEVTDIRVRWTLLSPPGEVALCSGDPPRNKPGNPERLTYVIAAHEGEAPLQSGFLSVVEAYEGDRVVREVAEAAVDRAAPGCRALRVALPGGRADTVFFGDGRTRVVAEGRIAFDGLFGVYSETDGGSTEAFLVGGTQLGTPERGIRGEPAAWEGTVEAREDGCVWTSAAPPDGRNLTGRYLSVANDNERDACYRIVSVARDGNRTRVDVGDQDFIRGMVDDLDYAKGFRYDFEPGQPFRVVLQHHRVWD